MKWWTGLTRWLKLIPKKMSKRCPVSKLKPFPLSSGLQCKVPLQDIYIYIYIWEKRFLKIHSKGKDTSKIFLVVRLVGGLKT